MALPARVLAIVGPTGTGKTELAVEVARRTGAEIISADSMQVYRGMDVGTAKPPAQLRAEVPHHLIDVADPDESMSAGRYARLARAAAAEIQRRDAPVVLCGGTGLYARAFARGLLSDAGSSESLRARLEALSSPQLRERLETSDPEAAGVIHPHDRVRLVRALELVELGGRPASQQRRTHGFQDQPFQVAWLGLDAPRPWLWERLRRRVDEMFTAGLVAEVERLYAAGHGPSLRPLRAIGYREVGQLLAGELDEAEARARIYLATRRYAKRQRTWFRAEPGLKWADITNPGAALEQALAMLVA